MGESLEAFAESEADGGTDGPEIRGTTSEPRLADFRTRSRAMRNFVEVVRRVVPVDTSLLITGPTGSGKERLARAIHAEGARSQGPFLTVNCGALPEALLESELFGHEKGAFTGAVRQRQGHFEAATGGTILLDEIGEMPQHLQVKLLRVLQGHGVVRIGGHRPIPVDVRVISATNRDLAAEVERGRFREDLFYRLNVVVLQLPALVERLEDIPDLAGRFIAHFRESMPSSAVESISEEAVEALMQYPWPGNVRELINVIERAMVLGRHSDIRREDLPPDVLRVEGRAGSAADRSSSEPRPTEWRALKLREVRDLAVRDAETAYLRALLSECGGHVAETARRAGMSSRALYERMKRYGLRKEQFKDAGERS
jgi:DNA-binding NtrC family response regulator